MTPRRVMVQFKHASPVINRTGEFVGQTVSDLFNAPNSPRTIGSSVTGSGANSFWFPLNVPGATWGWHGITAIASAGEQPNFFDQYFGKYKYMRCYSAKHRVRIRCSNSRPMKVVYQKFGYETPSIAALHVAPAHAVTDPRVPPMAGKTLAQVNSSPYTRVKKFGMSNNQNIRYVSFDLNMANPTKWFEENRRQMVSEGDKPWEFTTNSGNKWVSDCNNATTTYAAPPVNQVVGNFQVFVDYGGTAAQAALTDYGIQITSSWVCEFFDPKPGTEYVVDEVARLGPPGV